MARNDYTPFLKFKANEVGAISELESEIKEYLIPFFDLPRKEDMTDESFEELVDKSAKKAKKLLNDISGFFVDNFDIPDDVTFEGGPNYDVVINKFQGTGFIPVVGLDRTPDHIQAVVSAKRKGLIASPSVGIRLQIEDFDSYAMTEGDLRLLCSECDSFDKHILILDCHFCLTLDPTVLAQKASDFIDKARENFSFEKIIVTGSSIPASISGVARVEQESLLERVELQIYSALSLRDGAAGLGLGDYTIVSPLYSDLTLPPEMMLNVTAPKVLYSIDNIHYIARGGALRTHRRGNLQYNDIALEIVGKSFYRGANYSYGDNFLYEKSKNIGSMVTPGSILKPTINAHMTYMANDYPKDK